MIIDVPEDEVVTPGPWRASYEGTEGCEYIHAARTGPCGWVEVYACEHRVCFGKHDAIWRLFGHVSVWAET